MLDVRVVQAAAVKIIARAGAFAGPDPPVEKHGRRVVGFVHRLAQPRRRLAIRIARPVGQFETRALRQQLHRVDKFHPFHFHHEMDQIAAFVAAKAII